MTTASELRRGLAFVEIGIDEAFLRAELGKAQAQVGQFAATLRSAGAGAGGGAFGGFLAGADIRVPAGIRAMTALHVGTRLATAGLQGVTEALRGDYDAADMLHAVFKKLPFGIGEFHQALLDIRGELDGTAAALRRSAAAKAAWDKEMGARGAVIAITDRLKREGGALGLSGLAADKYAINARADAELKAIDKLALGAEVGSNRAVEAFIARREAEKNRGFALSDAERKDYEKREAERFALMGEDAQAEKAFLADLGRDVVQQEKKAGEDRWREIEEGAERDSAARWQEIDDVQKSDEELARLRQSVETPAERIRALQDKLLITLGLEPGDELYQRLMGEALEEGVQDAAKRTSQARGTYSGREAGLLGRGGGAADALVDLSKQQLLEQKKIALAAEAGFRWSN